VDEWDRAHFDGHTTTVAVEHDDLGIGDRLVGDDLPCERLARAASLLGDTTELNWRPRTSPTRRSPAGFTQRITPCASMT
jgi:hypothetical protein